MKRCLPVATDPRAARIAILRRAAIAGEIVVAADPRELARARRRGGVAIDARLVAEAMLAAEPCLRVRDRLL